MSRRREQVRAWQGWAGAALGPFSWALHLNASFVIAHWFCDTPSWVLHGITATTALVAAVGTALSWQARRRTAERDGADAQRSLASARFVATLGVMIGLLSTTGILVGGLPPFFLEPCR